MRAEEKSREVSIGLREDPIQPLVIRANEGDCVNVTLTNNATGGSYGIPIDGVAFDSSGDDVGVNGSSEAAAGQTRSYKFYVPNDPTIEGSHYLHPGPGHRDAVDHGLFGVLAVEPPGSRYLSPLDLREIRSGWEAVIQPGDAELPRERADPARDRQRVGDVYDKFNKPLPTVGKITETYRPGGRGFNYRSEPFDDRLGLPGREHEKAHSYASTVFGDPATIVPRGYVGDPTKFRIVHAGAEVFHVYHLHGGGDRWRENPVADGENNYADTGLKKYPVETSQSDRLDAQSTGPGESFSAEIESGAGGTQQGAGDFLFHCHVAEHYPAGMWGFWRVFDTLQPDVTPLPDRAPFQPAVPSDQLIGKTMPDGTVHHGREPRRLDPSAAAAARSSDRRPGRVRLELDRQQLEPGRAGLPGRARTHEGGDTQLRAGRARALRVATRGPVRRQPTEDPVRSRERQTGIPDAASAQPPSTTVLGEPTFRDAIPR